MSPSSQIEIYQSDDGQTRIEVRLEQDTLRLYQAQLAELLEKEVRIIIEHLGNTFKEGELNKQATIRKFRIVRQVGWEVAANEDSSVVRQEGRRQVRCKIPFQNY